MSGRGPHGRRVRRSFGDDGPATDDNDDVVGWDFLAEVLPIGSKLGMA